MIAYGFISTQAGRPRLPLVLALLTLTGAATAQVTTRDDAVGRLLNEWYAKGQAAGLAGIVYENRDGGHSPLNLAAYPQLKAFEHGPGTGSAKGPAETLRSVPTVGNCSMAAPAENGGSLPRLYQMNPKGLEFLTLQYVANQVFVYPEHQDHDPGANGVGGYGDLYPANNATMIISQGSSGSDQPFVNALLTTIAALPPTTRQLLIEKRLLMPAVQAIFRRSNRMVKSEADYFTGAAHPVAFDAAQIDEEKMVRAAHAMTPAQAPPIVQVRVLEETPLTAGKHFFEPPGVVPHRLADSPVSVARIMRGNMAFYELAVTAAKSGDLQRRPLEIRWQVLQGDPAAVEIEPAASGKEARLRVRWQKPFTAASGIRSHRLDVGIFATNGISVSTPAFLSFYHLPNEMRFHDSKGRVSEICYQAHNPDLGLPTAPGDPRWLKLMLAISIKGDGLKSRLMQRLLPAEEREAIQAVWLRLNAQDPAELEPAISAALQTPLLGEGKATLRQTLESALSGVVDFADLYPSFQRELLALAAKSPKATAAADVRAEVARLVKLGVLIEEASGGVVPVSPLERLTSAERYYLGGLNLTLLSQVLFPEALERSTAPAWVDARLTTPKPWRDVYRYDEKNGALTGWIRHGDGRAAAFDAEGRFLPEGFKKTEVAKAVVYEKGPDGLLQWREP